jgi:hypothetical protein
MIAMSEAAAVIFGALIGAGGAIVAQVTTGIATARRDRSRLDWEKERQDREWGMREQERFLAIKQEHYARFGAAVDEFLLYVFSMLHRNEWIALPLTPDLPHLEPLGLISSNIELMAPEEVWRPVELCLSRIMNTTWAIDAGDITPDDLSQAYDEARSAWQDALHAMRQDLHGYRQRFNRPAPGAVDVPPDRASPG